MKYTTLLITSSILICSKAAPIDMIRQYSSQANEMYQQNRESARSGMKAIFSGAFQAMGMGPQPGAVHQHDNIPHHQLQQQQMMQQHTNHPQQQQMMSTLMPNQQQAMSHHPGYYPPMMPQTPTMAPNGIFAMPSWPIDTIMPNHPHMMYMSYAEQAVYMEGRDYESESDEEEVLHAPPFMVYQQQQQFYYAPCFMSVRKTLAEWKKLLTPQQFLVLRENGTEAPFTNAYWKVNEEGEYNCAGCGALLFKSDDKFFSQCGWPAFSQPATQNIILKEDNSHGMQRIEVRCGSCDGHLGHVFDDGPAPLNTRYCINSASLNFNKKA